MKPTEVEIPHINRTLWRIGRIATIPVFRLLYRLRISGRSNVPRTGGLLIVSNHRSFLDPPLIGYAASPRKSYYMAKHIIFRVPAFAWLITRLGAFPVVRETADRNAIRTARALLAEGHCLLMFPEGTRGKDPDGAMLPGMPGAGMLAFDEGVTVVPAAVWDARRKLGPVRVGFGPPIDMTDLLRVPRNQRNQMATERIMDAIGAVLDEVRAADRR